MTNKQIINTQFWETYSKLYNKFTPKFQKELLNDISNFAQGEVYDFGCGVGKLHKYLEHNKKIETVTAYDSCPQMLDFAIKNKPTNLNIKYINSQKENKKYDSIYLINVLYANSNPIDILSSINSKLNKNGVLIIGDLKRENILNNLYSQMQKEFPNDPQLETYYKMNQHLSINSFPSPYRINELESIIKLLGDFKTVEKNEKYFLGNLNNLIIQKN